MNAGDVRVALRNRFKDGRRYAIAEEVGLTTGFSHRRLDMMVLDCYASNTFRIDGIEIKVSKADLKRELEDPEKHTCFFDFIDYYSLACPDGVADMDVIPKKWGVLIVREDGTTRWRRKPIALHDEREPRPVPRGFFASVTRAIQGKSPGADELRAEYDRGTADGAKSERNRMTWEQRETERYKKDSDAYWELKGKLRLYGLNTEEKMAAFERFAELDTEMLVRELKRADARITELVGMLEGGDDGKGRA